MSPHFLCQREPVDSDWLPHRKFVASVEYFKVASRRCVPGRSVCVRQMVREDGAILHLNVDFRQNILSFIFVVQRLWAHKIADIKPEKKGCCALDIFF